MDNLSGNIRLCGIHYFKNLRDCVAEQSVTDLPASLDRSMHKEDLSYHKGVLMNSGFTYFYELLRDVYCFVPQEMFYPTELHLPYFYEGISCYC